MTEIFSIAFVYAWSAPVAFGFFAAYWAQQTGRNAWLWLLFGVLLMPLAGIVLLMLNGDRKPTTPDNGLGHLIAVNKDLP
ncbi:hypothetical protein WCE39_08970 [Luteimonas sp. MJ174]|uniref:hypothetical protein n=1 Tax=Luteimonas sp. MJ174 TaxID=3129237 RepID=UPI0031BB1663